jgi:hypothetical protein
MGQSTLSIWQNYAFCHAILNLMKSKMTNLLCGFLFFMVCFCSSLYAVSDAELEALEKQLEKQETEEKEQAEAEAKRKAKSDAEKKRYLELEKQRLIENKKLEQEREKINEEKRKVEEERRIIEKARQSELDRKRKEDEAKQLVLEEQKRKEEEIAKSKVTIVLVRLSRYVGSLVAVPMKFNDMNIASLPNGSFQIFTSSPGQQTISTDSGYEGYDIDKNFNFEPGQLYYIKVGVGFSYSIELISNTEGRSGIKGLKNIGKINPADVLSDYDESEAYKENTSIQEVPL